jgi:DNA-binding NarL/FixJ family response regulator
MPAPIKVCLVEDNASLRESMSTLLNASEEFRCVGAFPNAETALQRVLAACPDVILMDINLPKMSGIECVARLKEMRSDLHIIMLTICGDDEQIFESLKAGASGYLLKKSSPADVFDAITEVHSGGAPMSSGIARKVVRFFQQQQQKAPAPVTDLTKREVEILSYLVKGFQYKEIADALSIGGATVRTHIDHIYQKLHVRSRTEAVVKYLQGSAGTNVDSYQR